VATCKDCGQSGFFLKIVFNGLCAECAARFSLEVPRLVEIINQSAKIVDQTKNLETGISRCDVIIAKAEELLRYERQGISVVSTPPSALIVEYQLRRKALLSALEEIKGDHFLRLDGAVYRDTPKELVPLIHTIKRASDWRNLGFKAKADKHGRYKGFTRKGTAYSFQKITKPSERQSLAIEFGKKYISNLNTIRMYNTWAPTFPLDQVVFESDDLLPLWKPEIGH